ncbi:MAG: class I SAM-dependent methyltransferase [Cyanobacteria bacterium P01_H01_bin.119]
MLTAIQRDKLDPTNDSLFYDVPRFVTHVDQGFIDRLGDLYRDRLRPQSRIFDMMSSWVSHLPSDITFSWVEGHGMNGDELAKNPCLDHYFVQNLNDNQVLPLEDNSFDAVLNTVSIQYLQYPKAVFAEIYRILKPGGIAIISFSNRMFYQKAIALWRDGSETQRVNLVKRYFESVPGFSATEVVSEPAAVPGILQLLGMPGGDPFYAVIAEKMVPLVSESE